MDLYGVKIKLRELKLAVNENVYDGFSFAVYSYVVATGFSITVA